MKRLEVLGLQILRSLPSQILTGPPGPRPGRLPVSGHVSCSGPVAQPTSPGLDWNASRWFRVWSLQQHLGSRVQVDREVLGEWDLSLSISGLRRRCGCPSQAIGWQGPVVSLLQTLSSKRWASLSDDETQSPMLWPMRCVSKNLVRSCVLKP